MYICNRMQKSYASVYLLLYSITADFAIPYLNKNSCGAAYFHKGAQNERNGT